MMKAYGVYARADSAGRVTAVNSDAFLTDLTGWVKIDEGEDERCMHAQGNYLPEPLMDERGVYRYKLAGDAIIERTPAEMDADYVPPVPYVSEAEKIATIAFVVLAEAEIIDDVTAVEHPSAFEEWQPDVSYVIGNIRRYDEELYRCNQPHTSQEDWTPDATLSLWTRIADPSEEWPDWSQPIGAHDAYAKGDKVNRNGKHWVSAVDGNVWEPGVYGWEEVVD